MKSAESLVGVLLALQLGAFGWRINREIPLGDAGRRTWFPLADWINVLALLGVIALCVVVPLVTDDFGRLSKTVLGAAYIFIGLHPVNVARHYRLSSKRGRSVYLDGPNGDYPYVTDHEALSLALSVIGAAVGS